MYQSASRSLAVLLLGIVGCSKAPAPEPTKPLGRVPVVIILLDALSAGHVAHLGYPRPTTPNIDSLAADGVTFAQSFAPAPYTLASIPSLFTGRLPDTHGLVSSGNVLPDEEQTLAEQLRDVGYKTYGAVNNLMGSSLFRLEQGFDTYYEMFRGEARERINEAHPTGEDLVVAKPEEFIPVVEEWLGERDPDVPVFYFLHLLEPHQPYDPPAEFRERFLPADYEGQFADGFVATDQWKGREGMSAEDRDALRDLYDANIAWADAQVGRMLDLMKADGLYDEALVIVTSDHGEAFWQHGMWGHSYQIYDEMLQVPLVVKPPAGTAPRGEKIDALAGLIDVVPTVCDWLELPIPKMRLDGVSLAGVIAGNEAGLRDRTLYLRTNHKVPTVGSRTETTKTIINHNRPRGPELEYYEVDDDPDESSNLARSFFKSRRAKRQADAVGEWIKNAKLNSAKRGRELRPEELDLIHKLGYVE